MASSPPPYNHQLSIAAPPPSLTTTINPMMLPPPSLSTNKPTKESRTATRTATFAPCHHPRPRKYRKHYHAPLTIDTEPLTPAQLARRDELLQSIDLRKKELKNMQFKGLKVVRGKSGHKKHQLEEFINSSDEDEEEPLAKNYLITSNAPSILKLNDILHRPPALTLGPPAVQKRQSTTQRPLTDIQKNKTDGGSKTTRRGKEKIRGLKAQPRKIEVEIQEAERESFELRQELP
ncbi:hypothetical protein FQN53_004017 [Emmonsiellopsis sp. PD_33]|nr:hypothetical protein FQN53_004017 [Emmonsiellopsis sp. PD_33]